MKRVAVCSYWYPPTRTIASLRIGKFAKYLPDFGWDPFIFTIAPRTDRYLRAGGLLDEGPPGQVERVPDPSTHVLVDRLLGIDTPAASASRSVEGKWWYRTALRAYGETMRFPDEAWPWLLHYRRVRHAVERIRPDVVFSSSPPATSHLLARRLSRDLGIPWIADFRDPWSTNAHARGSPWHRAANRYLERRTLSDARAITTVSWSFRDMLVALHGKPTYVVTNGFDPRPHPIEPVVRDPRMVLTYTGLLYSTGGVALLFEAIDRLLAAGHLAAGQAIVRLYGRNQDVARASLNHFERVRPFVELCGEVSYEESLSVQRAADALLLLESPEPWSRGIVPAKLFEYLDAGRPIVATGPQDGDIDRILRETRAGTVASTSDGLADRIGDLLGRFAREGGIEPSSDQAAIATYTRRAVTGRLAQVLDGVTS